MPVDLGQIPQQDRQDFESRLGVYGLNASAVQEPLIVSGTKVMLNYGPNRETARQPFVVQTSDFAAVKRMVGIQDKVFKTIAPRVTLPTRIELNPRITKEAVGNVRDAPRSSSYTAAPGHGLDDPASAAGALGDVDLSSLDDEAVDNIRVAARAYVRGNSAMVASYKPIVEATIGRVTIPVWPLLTIRVASGSVLELGPGVHALVAYQVIVEQGGMIRSRGHLTINCTKLSKPGKIVINKNPIGIFKPIFSE